MRNNFFCFLIILITLFSSCDRSSRQTSDELADTVLLTVASFDTSAYALVEKPVLIEGTVYHTCKHGGKRLFLIDGTDSIRVEVTTGPDIVKFEESLVGSSIRILGILKEERIDEKYLNEWEAEVKQPAEGHETGLHTGAKGHEDQDTQAKLDQINALREQLKNSGQDHLSFYSIEAISFTELK